MTIELSETAANVMLDALSSMMNGGHIDLMSEQRVLAVLQLADPAAQFATSGELEFNAIGEEDAALAQGNAVSAIIIGADGGEVLRCDVGDENSDAVIKLNSTRIFRGGPVRINSFRLVMP